MFRVRNAPRVMLVGLLLSLGSLLGFVLCYFPGIAFGVFAGFTIHFMVDRNLGPLESISASFGLVVQNFGNVLLVVLVSIALAGAGPIAA